MNENKTRVLTPIEMQRAVLKGERGNFNIEQALEALLEFKARGESVSFVFNGIELKSDEITTVEETSERLGFRGKDSSDRRTTMAITTTEIGQATINAPTTHKMEAEQVENGENTKDTIKEGEEVGDDN